MATATINRSLIAERAEGGGRPAARGGDSLKSRDSLYGPVAFYVKVTSAGKLTLPKKVREGLGLRGSGYVRVALLGKAVVIRRVYPEDKFFDDLRAKVKRVGLTRARMRELVDEAGREAWRKHHGRH